MILPTSETEQRIAELKALIGSEETAQKILDGLQELAKASRWKLSDFMDVAIMKMTSGVSADNFIHEINVARMNQIKKEATSMRRKEKRRKETTDEQ